VISMRCASSAAGASGDAACARTAGDAAPSTRADDRRQGTLAARGGILYVYTVSSKHAWNRPCPWPARTTARPVVLLPSG
jgi:hypothetical protein